MCVCEPCKPLKISVCIYNKAMKMLIHFYNNVTLLCNYLDNILVPNETNETSALLLVIY